MTGKLSVVVRGIYDFLVENKDTLGEDIDIWMGDQNLYPRTPAVTVLGGESRRELVTRPLGTDVTFDVFVMVVHSEITPTENNVLGAQEFAESVEDLLHTNLTLGDLVLFGMVQRIEMGEIPKATRLLRVSRLTWQGIQRDILPS